MACVSHYGNNYPTDLWHNRKKSVGICSVVNLEKMFTSITDTVIGLLPRISHQESQWYYCSAVNYHIIHKYVLVR